MCRTMMLELARQIELISLYISDMTNRSITTECNYTGKTFLVKTMLVCVSRPPSSSFEDMDSPPQREEGTAEELSQSMTNLYGFAAFASFCPFFPSLPSFPLSA